MKRQRSLRRRSSSRSRTYSMSSVGEQVGSGTRARGQAGLREAAGRRTCTRITPSAYAEFGDAVVNTLSYQQARQFNVPVRGVFVANPGYVFGAAGIPRGAGDHAQRQSKRRHAEGLRGGHRRSSATAITPPCATSPSTIRTAAICAPFAWTGCGSRRITATATTTSGVWDCNDLPAGPAPKASAGELHGVPEVPAIRA